MLKKIGRIIVFVIAALFILLSVAGIAGAWWVNSVAANVTLKAFSVVETGVGVVDAGVTRVDGLVQTGRTEVQQAQETITTVSGNLQANNPVLQALSDRLDTRLGPTVDKIQEAVAPVRDALGTVSNAVSFANSIPFIHERAPRLDQLDTALSQLGAMAADVQQLRSTLRAAAEGQADQVTQQTATALTTLTSRVDARLAEIQTGIQQIQTEIEALQTRLQALKSRLLLIYNLTALAATLLFLWVIYSQIVVIRHHWRLLRAPGPAPALDSGAVEEAPAPAAPAAAPASPEAAASETPASAEASGEQAAAETPAEASSGPPPGDGSPDSSG
jgi:predicted  nucleic acid-binding Zn-ribbon protein